MKRSTKLVFLLIICSLNFKASIQIYVPDENINQKPITYTSGIKTRPSQVELHHNYSRVYHQNHGTYSDDNEETFRRPYPVYHADTHGQHPPNQIYILNGTRIRKNENPTRRIFIYNKQKRSPEMQIYRTCPRNVTGQFIYEASCNQFLNCWKGRGYVQNCAPGTLFNPKSLECDFPHKVFCISGPRQTTLQTERSTRFIKQVGCPKEFSGLIPNYTDCSKFINCVSGIENLMDCPPGTLFDINKNICDFAHKATCFNGQNRNLVDQNIDGKLDFESGVKTNEKQKLSYRFNEVRCPESGSGLYPHPGDCSKFLNCADGLTYIQNCSPGTLFNPVLKICDFPYNVRCQNGTGSGISIVDYDAGYYDRHNLSGGYPGSTTKSHREPPYGHYGSSVDHYGSNYDNSGNQGYSSSSTSHSGRYNGYGNQESGYGNQNTQYSSSTDPSGYYGQSGHQYYSNGQPDYGRGSVSGYGDRPVIPNTPNNYLTHANRHTPNNYHSQGAAYESTNQNYGSPMNQYRPSSYDTQVTNQYKPNNYGYGSSVNQYRPNSYGNQNGGYSTLNQSGYYGSSGNQYRPNSYSNQNSGYDSTLNQSGYYGSSVNQYRPNSYSNQNSRYNNTSNQSAYYGTSVNQYIPNFDDNQNNGYDNTSNQPGYYGSSVNHYVPNTYGNRDSTSSQSGYYGSSINQDRLNSHNNGYDGTSSQSGYYDSSVNQYRPSSYGNRDNGQQSGSYGSSVNHYRPDEANVYDSSTNRYLPSRPIGGSDQNYHGQEIENSGYFGSSDQHGHNYHRPIGETEETSPQRPSSNQYGHQQNGRRPYDGRFTVIPDSTLSQNPYNGNQHNWRKNTDQNVWQVEAPTTTNYDEVVNINHMRKTTRTPFRNSYEPFFGSTTSKSNDYDDTFDPGHSNKFVRGTTPKIFEKNWPPPFPSTDVNADYVFDYNDNDEVSLEAENSVRDGDCGKSHFRCSHEKCIPKTLVCNGIKDCPNGQDELRCLEYVSKFSVKKNTKLAVLEKERWNNISIATCALLCVQSQKVRCRSFNYRKVDRTCLLTNTNEGLTGALISYGPFDYYELISEKINCSNMHVCSNKKCIIKTKICDGQDDCGDRMDEKGCKPENFGYRIRLTDSENRNEGHIEVSAFGKTGYICDDNFGLRDANVACKELGFRLGAVEVKKNSFYRRNFTDEKPFYMMDDVTCSGNESKLMDCDFSGWGVHNCLGQEIVGVVCKTPQEKCPDDYWQCDTGQECLPLAFVCDGLLDCTDGSDEGSQHCDAPTQIRLTNGTSGREGRIEIRHHGIWGTICDDDFNEDAAKVVCKQLGYRGSAFVRKDGYFGAGSGPIWLDQVFCSGNESNIESCTHWNWGEHNCEHSEDVGVVCSNVHEYERHSSIPVPTIPQEYPDRCGYRKDSIFNRDDDVHFRVVKGSIARRGDYPWQAAIRVKGKRTAAHWCGAVIISEKFVLTAAHCLIGYSKGAYIIVAGDYNVDEDEGTEQEVYIEDFYIHEKFREGHKMNNDIALVKLKGRGFRFSDDVQPICLPDPGTSYETDQNCTISGFGSIQSGKSAFSHDLRAGWVPLQKRQICAMPHVYGDAMTEGMICAGSLDEGIDSCDGDSGGPLACLNQGVFTLYGITSWGQHCGYANKPGVYVKVAHYRKWIDDNFYKHSSS